MVQVISESCDVKLNETGVGIMIFLSGREFFCVFKNSKQDREKHFNSVLLWSSSWITDSALFFCIKEHCSIKVPIELIQALNTKHKIICFKLAFMLTICTQIHTCFYGSDSNKILTQYKIRVPWFCFYIHL